MKSKKQNGSAKVSAVKSEAAKDETVTGATKTNDRKRQSTEAIQAVKPKMKKEEEVSTPNMKLKKRKNKKKKNAATGVVPAGRVKPPRPPRSEEDEASRGGISIAYLKLWKEDRKKWKFQKIRQIWLNDNMLNSVTLSDDVFPTWLEYMAGSSDRQKKFVVKKAEEALEELEAEDSTIDAEDVKYQRAREIIQSLHTKDDEDSSS